MQVTLTPHAEQLLRQAIARSPGQTPEEIIEDALAERLSKGSGSAFSDPVWTRLQAIAAVTLPDHWPPHFATLEPVRVEEEPVSEQLIRERR